jgi:hypothetical protein
VQCTVVNSAEDDPVKCRWVVMLLLVVWLT